MASDSSCVRRKAVVLKIFWLPERKDSAAESGTESGTESGSEFSSESGFETLPVSCSVLWFVSSGVLETWLSGDSGTSVRVVSSCAVSGAEACLRLCAGEQSQGVGFAPGVIHAADDSLVAGQLDIFAEQQIACPNQRMEPVYRQNQEAQGLEQMVSPGDMCLLVGQYMGQLVAAQIVVYINLRSENAQNKGRSRKLTLADIVPEACRSAHFQAQADKTSRQIQKHDKDAGEPDAGGDESDDLQRIGAGLGRGGKGGGDHGIELRVHGGNAAGDSRCRTLQNRFRNGLGAGNQAERTGQCKGTEQANPHQHPQKTANPPGSFPENDAKQQHSENQPACADAEIDTSEKNGTHSIPPIVMFSFR